MSKKKGFTLIELIGVLVILAIITLIATPLVMSIIRKAKINARKRSVDAYGRSVELAIAGYLMDTGAFPTNEKLPNLNIEYSGSNVVCNVMQMKKNGGLYLSQCKVNNIEVKDSNEEDGYYHYGTRDLTNCEIIEMYGKAIEKALKEYHDTNNNYPSDISYLTIDYTGEKVEADILINKDGTVYLTNCRVSGIPVDIVYGEDKTPATDKLLAKTNSVSITNYTDGDTHEMYTFEHPETVQTPALTDYRYIGSDPYNYVTFNNELWRIVGVFSVDDGSGNYEQRIKLIRNKIVKNEKWNSTNVNEWVGSTMQVYLNDDYTLDDASVNLIADAKYYLGGQANPPSTGEEFYKNERGENVASADRSKNWIGLVGLLYPSDNIYTFAFGVDDICYNTPGSCNNSRPSLGWLYESSNAYWSIMPLSSSIRDNFYIQWGSVWSTSTYATGIGARPVVYLKPDVRIKEGDGTSLNPYQLEI